jgi:hypothetical protein
MVKSHKLRFSVIPAKEESSTFKGLEIPWTPVFTGETTFYETIISNYAKKVHENAPIIVI